MLGLKEKTCTDSTCWPPLLRVTPFAVVAGTRAPLLVYSSVMKAGTYSFSAWNSCDARVPAKTTGIQTNRGDLTIDGSSHDCLTTVGPPVLSSVSSVAPSRRKHDRTSLLIMTPLTFT